MSPTGRSLKYLRDRGWIACVVEKWLPQIKVRKDAFGFGDLLAAHPVLGQVVLVQATSRPNVSSRVGKAKAIPELRQWLQAGGKFWVIGWARAKGTRRWEAKIVDVPLDGVPVVTAGGKRRGRTSQQKDLFQ